MRRAFLVLLAVAGAGGVGAAPQGTPPAPVSGSYAFRTHCAVCHGASGRGDGPLADQLRYHPADLTGLARRNGGEFPTELVVRIVDGRKPVKGHGGPDMPVWGDAFRNVDTSFDEAAAQERIRAVVDHLKTIQAGAK
ncbi:MAG TPA: c-type cytochrome [Planctomycetota bacterium]|nr:c-type cytochrome [Planctomycetota bacterium]